MKYIYLLLFTTSLMAADVSKTENEVREYIKLKKEIVHTKNNWDFEKSVLESELKLLKKQKQDLIEKKSKKQAQNSQLKQNLSDRTNENEWYEKRLDQHQQDYNNLNIKLFEISPILPTALRKKVEAYTNSSGRQELSRRLRVGFSLLEEIVKTSQAWHFSRETIKVGQKDILVDILYAGLASAYAMTDDGSKTYTGFVKSNKWIWQEQQSFSSQKRKAIKSFKSQSINQLMLPFAGGFE